MFGKRSSERKLHLLLVNSEAGNIRAAREGLEGSRSAFAVDVAMTPEAAVEKLSSGQYDCGLLDPDVFNSAGWKLDEVLATARPDTALVVLCHTRRPRSAPDVTDLTRVTFLDSEALRSPGLAEKVSECLEVARALEQGQVDALLLPGAGTASPLLVPGSERSYRRLVETLQEGILTTDSKGVIIFTNRQVGEILGCDPDSLLGENVLALAEGEGQLLIRAKMDEALQGTGSRCESTLAYRGQPAPHLLVTFGLIDDVNGSAPGVSLALTDLSEEKRLRDELERQAITDPLTGLSNRRYLAEALGRECRRARRYRHDLSCLMMDLDNFKLCNDMYGHLVGDSLLRQVAVQIKRSVRDTDVAARYGGEEFCALLPETHQEGAMVLAERIRSTVAATDLVVAGRSISIAVSIGVFAANSTDDLEPETLLACADVALREAKAAGKNRVCGHPSRSPGVA